MLTPDQELDIWLEMVSETALAHIAYIQDREKEEPESLTNDDYGLLNLETAFLTLYAMYKENKIVFIPDEVH